MYAFPNPSPSGPTTLALAGTTQLFVIIFLALFFVLVVAILVRTWQSRPAPALGPLAAAQRRYANGEIRRKEYLRICADLGEAPQDPPHGA